MVSGLNILVWKLSQIAGQKRDFFLLILPYKTWCKPRFANFGISLEVLSFAFWMIFSDFQKNRVLGYFWSNKTWWNHASQWIRDLWSKGLSLILSYFQTFLSFYFFGDFFPFFKKIVFWVFLVHPPMASVLLSASVKRCFVSRMRDFSIIVQSKNTKCIARATTS